MKLSDDIDNRSDLCASGQQVRALEWTDLGGGSFRAFLPIFGSVRVEPYGCCDWWEVLWSMPGQCDKLIPDVFDNPDDAKAAAQAEFERRILAALIPAPDAPQEPTCTGVKDKDGNVLFLGDQVRYRIEGSHTKEEYWNPEYEIVWKAPSFTLKHVGGGKDGGSHDFKLRCGGGNGVLELVKRGPHAAAPQPAGDAVPVAWMLRDMEGVICAFTTKHTDPAGTNWTPLYARPPQPSETVAELVGWWERQLEYVQNYPAPLFAEKIKQTVAALRALKGGE